MPRASFSHAVTVAQPVGAVWESLQDASTWSGIGPVDEVWEPRHDAAGNLEGFRWSARLGPTRYKGGATVSTAEPPHLMTLALDSSELAGSLTADLGGSAVTQLEVTLDIVAKGAMASLFFPVVAEAVARGLPEQVERFAASLAGDGGSPTSSGAEY